MLRILIIFASFILSSTLPTKTGHILRFVKKDAEKS